MAHILFVSAGMMYEDAGQADGPRFDRWISGTIMHELGHVLCLHKPGQGGPPGCDFRLIDNQPASERLESENYRSVMNYRYQFGENRTTGIPTVLGNFTRFPDYSYGEDSNAVGEDFDDWAAIDLRGIETGRGDDPAHGAEYHTQWHQKVPVYVPPFRPVPWTEKAEEQPCHSGLPVDCHLVASELR